MPRKKQTQTNKQEILLTNKEMHKMVDSLTNFVTSMGTARDPRTASRFNYLAGRTWNSSFYAPGTQNLLEFDRIQLDSMYLSDWLSGKVIDIPVHDSLREWRTVSFGDDQEKVKIYEDAERKFKIRQVLSDVLKWARLYGGAAIVLGIDGAGDPSLPLDINKVKRGSLKWIKALDKWYLTPQYTNVTDITASDYFEPSHYSIATSDITIHASRVIKFIGIEVPLFVKSMLNYWGGSILTRIYDALINANIIPNTVASLMLKSNTPLVKIPDINNILSTDGGTNRLQQRFGQAQLLASNQNMMLLDEKESYELIKPDFSEAQELIQEFIQIVAGAADIPVARLAGRAISGLNSTGDTDIRNYYDSLKGYQIDVIKPGLDRLDEILLRNIFGEVPQDYEYDFNPLWQLTDAEQADLELKNAQRDNVYLQSGVLTEDIVAKQLQNNNTYSAIDDDYVASLSGIKAENPNQDYQELQQNGAQV